MTVANEYGLNRGSSSNKKMRYQKKVIAFGGKKVTLWSIDGITWSTRKNELLNVIERQEEERAKFGGQIKGGPQSKVKPKTVETPVEPEAKKEKKEEERGVAKAASKKKASAKKAPASAKEKKAAPAPRQRATSKAAAKKKTSSRKKSAAA